MKKLSLHQIFVPSHFQPLPSSFAVLPSSEDSSLIAAQASELPPKSELPPSDFSVSETSTQVITEIETTVLPSSTVLPLVAPSTVPSSETSFQKVFLGDEEPVLKVRSEGIFKRQVGTGGGRARLGGCGNERLRQVGDNCYWGVLWQQQHISKRNYSEH